MLDFKVYKKVQVDLLKRAISINSIMNLIKFRYRKGDGFTDIINSCYAIRIPNHYMFLDIEKILIKANCSLEMEEHESDTVESLIPTNEFKVVVGYGRKMILHKFIGETIGTIYLDSDYLKFFGKIERLNFRGINQEAPVYVYDNNELVGFILPVMVKGADK